VPGQQIALCWLERACLQVGAWRNETLVLWAYADKLAALARGIEGGRYRSIERGRLRSVLVPRKDGPGLLDARNLSRLAECTAVMDSWLASTGQVGGRGRVGRLLHTWRSSRAQS